MHFPQKYAILSLFFLSLVFIQNSSAASVTWNFSAAVTEWFGTDLDFLEIGESITGHITFSSDTPDQHPDPEIGNYWGAITAFNVTFDGGETFSFDIMNATEPNYNHRIDIFDDLGWFAIAHDPGINSNVSLDPLLFPRLSLSLGGPFMPNDNLSPSAPNLATTTYASFTLSLIGTGGEEAWAYAPLLTLSDVTPPTPVPAPAGVVLIAIGMAGLALRRSRNSQRSEPIE